MIGAGVLAVIRRPGRFMMDRSPARSGAGGAETWIISLLPIGWCEVGSGHAEQRCQEGPDGRGELGGGRLEAGSEEGRMAVGRHLLRGARRDRPRRRQGRAAPRLLAATDPEPAHHRCQGGAGAQMVDDAREGGRARRRNPREPHKIKRCPWRGLQTELTCPPHGVETDTASCF